MNYKKAMDYIEERSGLGYSMGLKHIKMLCEKLGNPQEDLKYVHVVGTNGKGSVSAFLTSILIENGYHVGTYSSPSVFSYEEKMRFDHKPIAKSLIGQLLEKMIPAIEEMEKEGESPTIFEIETALAFLFFQHKKCDIVVLEAGLGGLEDATNVIRSPELAVIASISLDHCDYLGNTVEEIAKNKSAIIKKGSDAVVMKQKDSIMEVVNQRCVEVGSTMHVAQVQEAKNIKCTINCQKFDYKDYKKVEISLLGTYQISNAILAIEASEVLKNRGFSIEKEKVLSALKKTTWLGRFSVISKKPYFVLDGAHNMDAAKKLRDSIDLYFTNKRIIYIMGILKDKDYEEIVKTTCDRAAHIITVATPNKQRTMSAFELAKVVEQYHPSVTSADSIEEAVEMSYLLAKKDDVIIAFGSLSYLGKMVEIVKKK